MQHKFVGLLPRPIVPLGVREPHFENYWPVMSLYIWYIWILKELIRWRLRHNADLSEVLEGRDLVKFNYEVQNIMDRSYIPNG